MPLYDYCCKSCEHNFEAFTHPGGEKARCPMCDGWRLEKRMTAPSKLSGVRAAEYKKSEAKKKRVNDIVKRQTEDKSL